MSNVHMPAIIFAQIIKSNRQTDFVRYQNSDMGTLGQRLKRCRKESGLKQAVVSARTGISQGTLSELENDKYPTSSFVPHLAVLYGVEALWLAEGKGQQRRNDNANAATNQLSEEAVAIAVTFMGLSDKRKFDAKIRLIELADLSRMEAIAEPIKQAERRRLDQEQTSRPEKRRLTD